MSNQSAKISVDILDYARRSREALDKFFSGNVERIAGVAAVIVERLSAGGKVVLFGNGGSAADAQHLAAEFSGRYLLNRRPLSAVALTTDTSSLTAISNDFGFERVFERQVLALVRKGDVAVGISTSGTSPNVLMGLRAARDLGAVAIGLSGHDGGGMAEVCDHLFVVEDDATPIIQQVHITLGHVLCGIVEETLFGKPGARGSKEGGR